MIESGAAADGPADTIKLHHNVGGLPAELGFELIEPLRDLFKDEVRRLGLQLGLPEEIVWRHPFPGPGLAVRCLGEVTREQLDTLREADAIVVGEIKAAGLVSQHVAGVRRAAAGAKRRRHGRRPHLRERARRAVREHRRLHDGRLEPPAVRAAGTDLDADHQRGEGREPRGVRHQLASRRRRLSGSSRVRMRKALAKARTGRLSDQCGRFSDIERLQSSIGTAQTHRSSTSKIAIALSTGYIDNQTTSSLRHCRDRIRPSHRAAEDSSGIASTITPLSMLRALVTSLLDNHYRTLGYLRVGKNLGLMMLAHPRFRRKFGERNAHANVAYPFWSESGIGDYFDGVDHDEIKCREPSWSRYGRQCGMALRRLAEYRHTSCDRLNRGVKRALRARRRL